jgi:hypothetical protein
VATHDYVIANGTGAAVRSDLNGALAAIVSNNSGATEPGTMYAYQWWADTTTGLLKLRNSANSAWISLRELDGTLTIEDGTAAAPGLAFTSDLNTGLFRVGADQIAISTGGTSRLAVSTTAVSSTLAVDVPLGAVGTPSLTFTGDLNTGVFSPGADTIALVTGGTNRVHVTSGGLVGIGSASPSHSLDVVGNIAVSQGSRFYLTNNSGFSPNITNTADANSMQFYQANTEKLRLDSSGRLLVGTSTSSGSGSTLQVRNDGSAAAMDIFRSDATTGTSIFGLNKSRGTAATPLEVANNDVLGYIAFRGYDGTTYQDAAYIHAACDGTWTDGGDPSDNPSRLVFSTTADGASSPTERMRINSSGQPLFQCTSSTTVGSHTGASNVSTFNFSGITLTQYSVSAGFYYDRLNFTNSQYFIVNSSGTGVYLGNGSTSWTAYSDERLKTNIVELDGAAAWNHCKTARAVTFNWRPENYPNNQKIGFIAQDWEASYPEVITTTNETIDGVETPKGMQYTETIPVLMAALKEAIAKIETLEARLTAAGIE